MYPAGPDPMMIRSRTPSCSAGGIVGCSISPAVTAGPGLGWVPLVTIETLDGGLSRVGASPAPRKTVFASILPGHVMTSRRGIGRPPVSLPCGGCPGVDRVTVGVLRLLSGNRRSVGDVKTAVDPRSVRHPAGPADDDQHEHHPVPPRSPAEPVPSRCPNGHGLISFGESVVTGHRNGNTRGHPGAVQEADPQSRVRAVESE